MREVYDTFSETPEDIVDNQARENDFIQKLLNRPEGRCSKEMQEILDKIDFEKLREIFLQVAQEYNVKADESNLNFLGKDRVFSEPGIIFVGGSYDVIDNIIFLSENLDPKKHDRSALKEAREDVIEKYGTDELFVLARLIHEETHAVSKNVCKVSIGSHRETVGSEIIETGYHTTTVHKQQGDRQEIKNSFEAFNEGVVEKLARDLTFKYLKKDHRFAKEAGVYKKALKNIPEKFNYAPEVALVEAIKSRLSQVVGIDEGEVWGVFIGSLLAGEKFQSEEVKNLFEKAFGADFLQELSELPSGSQGAMEKLVKKYHLDVK